MSHEKGIEAAAKIYYKFCRGTNHYPEQDAFDIVKAYLDASGMVMVPRKASGPSMDYLTMAIHRCAWGPENVRLTYAELVDISSATNRLQTPEESREKK